MTIDPSLVAEIAPRGVLRASINLGNPVLASSRTSPEQPAGVTVDLARDFARRLGVTVECVCFPRAADAGEAVANGTTDIAFLAVDPDRAQTLAFTHPYVLIEGAYVVGTDSPLQAQHEVDRDGVEVVVGSGSAYDLFLRRHLKHAQLTRVALSEQVVDEALRRPGSVAAGVRQQLEADLARLSATGKPALRMLDGRFMVIEQAAAMARSRSAAALAVLAKFIDEAVASGFVADALARHSIEGASVAPPR
ncbi:MAG: transporter substrate-binding domain-containing protein [Burkholderiaceae bacterium]